MAEDNSLIDWQEQLCRLVMAEWDKSYDYSSDLDDMYEDLYLMLRGERPNKRYDWQSDVSLSKVFQIVWTAIPYLTQKIFGADPVIGISSFDKKGAWERETILNFWYTMQPGNVNHSPYFLVVVGWLLRATLNGMGIIKKTWHQELKRTTVEQQVAVPMQIDEMGNETEVEPHMVKRTVSVPREDWPHNEVMPTKDVRGDWELQPGDSIRKGRFITHRSIVDLGSLYDSGLYFNLDKLNPSKSVSGSKLNQDHSDLKGEDDQENPPDSDFYTDVEIYERQGILRVYKKKDADGYNVPCFNKEESYDSDEIVTLEMVTTLARQSGGEGGDVLIRHEVNPYGEKGYVDIQLYLDPERWQATGMVEPVKDLIDAQTDNMNAMFDEIWQNLMPPVIVDKHALWDWDTMVYAPQQRWLVAGDPNSAITFRPPAQIAGDAWTKHSLLDTEINLTSAVTPPMQGAGKEKAATTNILNAQMSAGKLDFVLKMIEVTGLVPSAQMDIRFAKKFAHPLTFQRILGRSFQFGEWEEIYKYTPAASSVKLELQKEREVQEDMQLMQVVGSVPNPNTAKVLNILMRNILRNRGMPEEEKLFAEEYFEPKTDAGQLERINQQIEPGSPSNQNGAAMSLIERNVRRSTYQPRGLPQT